MADWPDQRLQDLFGVTHPIIQAPMAGDATPALASAVSNAGGLGSLGFAAGTVRAVQQGCAAMRAATNAPFNINLFVLPRLPAQTAGERQAMRARMAPFFAAVGAGEVPDPPSTPPAHGLAPEMLEALIADRPPVVSFHFGLPDSEAMARLAAAGIKVICTATTVAEAVAVEAAGCVAVIAQGWEAGGHRGAHAPNLPLDGVGTMALVPQVVDAVRIPVIAAGGIGDARGIAAAMMLGAAGVQMGSAFLHCPEAATDPARRALMAAARGGDTVATDAYSGRVARAHRSEYAAAMLPFAGQFAAYGQLYDFTDPMCAAAAGKAEEVASFHLYGQAAGLGRALPAGALVDALARGALALLGR